MTEFVNKCKHFNGIQNDCCESGVDYDNLSRNSEFRLPCIGSLNRDHSRDNRLVATCEKCSPYTNDELRELKRKSDEAFKIAMQNMLAISPLVSRIKSDNKRKNATGKDPCTACGTGEISWSHSGYNGHVWMRCSTDGCINFME